MDELARLAETLDLRRTEPASTWAAVGLIAEDLSDTPARLLPDRLLPRCHGPGPGTHGLETPRLGFAVQNLDTLDFPDGSFDALIAIDTLYMPNDLNATLRKMAALLKRAGGWASSTPPAFGAWTASAPRCGRSAPRWAKP